MLIWSWILYCCIFPVCEIVAQKVCHIDPASVLTRRTLDIRDLNEVIALLERHQYNKASYYRLGLRLLLSDNTLRIIEQEHKGQVDRCFTECLASWLRKADNVHNPTIDTLIAALRGIEENAVADNIDRERQTVLNEISILAAHPTLLTSGGPDQTQSAIVNPGVHDLEHRIDQVSMLRDIANKLLNQFGHLVVAVKVSLQSNEIDVDNAKEFIKGRLKRKARVAPNLMPCIDLLKKVKDFKSFFDFLSDYDFIGYLNYKLLKKLSELVNDDKLKQHFFEYEKEYAKLLSAVSFKDLIPLFEKQSDLSPTAPLGLPYVSFKIEKPDSFNNAHEWVLTFKKEFSWSQYAIFKQLRENCVIITYAILPCVFDDVIRDLKDPVILKKLEDKGVTVFELQQEEEKEVVNDKGIAFKEKRKQGSRQTADQQ
uniref:Death domain-containing protein n=1 Tax=Amphimedon queenslandica TaxID=400682 RepID=A0A1X7U9H5_AMPQE